MNYDLTEQIIRHIFKNIGIQNSANENQINSLIREEFLTHKSLELEEDGNVNKYPIYGCEITIPNGSEKISIVLSDISNEIPEYLLLVRLNNAPPYAVHLAYADKLGQREISNPLIAYYFVSSKWAECNTYLQATFLAGMEQLKDIHIPWMPIKSIDESYFILLEFLEFVDEKN